jgi:hypothetical protein
MRTDRAGTRIIEVPADEWMALHALVKQSDARLAAVLALSPQEPTSPTLADDAFSAWCDGYDSALRDARRAAEGTP